MITHRSWQSWLVAAAVCVACHAASAQTAIEGSDSSAAAPTASQFDVETEPGAITSLRRTDDPVDTQYIGQRRRLGDVLLAFRRPGAQDWQQASTATIDPVAGDAGSGAARYQVTLNGESSAALEVSVRFTVELDAIIWTLGLKNLTAQAVEIGDLALPLPMNSAFGRGPATSAAMKHSFISGHGSFIYWMRPGGVGPYLTLTPLPSTKLEYWEPPQRGPGGQRGQDSSAAFWAFIHSVASGERAGQHGGHWRQPHTSLKLAAAGESGDETQYGFKLRWADDLDAVRQILVDEHLVDVQVIPGMTVPSDLFARIALRTLEPIDAVEAEFPAQTEIESLGRRGDYSIYELRFQKLGENRVTVRYSGDRHVYLEFFATEPVETLIKKRAAFLARSQHRDPTKWYRGLISDWNMETQVLLGPDNYDRIEGFRIYAVTCDDPGLGKPAFLAAKNAEFPVQSEIEALDEYIEHFVWGGLQRTTDETYPYGIYGIPDWKRNRESDDPGRNGKLHIWRCYDYPHIVLLYHSMYRIAKHAPQLTLRLAAGEYLRRAAGTAIAMFTVPREVEGWSAYRTGFYNELVIVDLLRDLEAADMQAEADALRGHWERKVKYFVADNPDLFRSEYPFDSTGFESTHAFAKYAMTHADNASGPLSAVTPAAARTFMDAQLAANIFCRGSIEPAYYYLGSDYRGGGGNGYTLTYMSQMGGWSVLDYALNFAEPKRADYLRLGYASYLSAWALINSGTPDSNYGYWYPGEGNDGAAGGGFEPAPFGRTWLGQPHHRGSWYYACESDLGFSGALRAAATVVTDDPIFGRVCLGGDLTTTEDEMRIVPRDGLRRRFHAALDDGQLSLELGADRFAANQPLVLSDDLQSLAVEVESDDPNAHQLTLQLSGEPGPYRVTVNGQAVADISLDGRLPSSVEVSIPAGGKTTSVIVTRRNAAASP